MFQSKFMKQKNIKKRNNKSKKRDTTDNIFFEVILMIMIIPLFSFLTLSIFSKSKNISYNVKSNTQKITITTEKRYYNTGEKIELSVKNKSINSIYFEPCEYLDKFEKKIDEKWRESFSYGGKKIYDEFGFKREDNITNCKIELPKEGTGIYRAVVRIYYECEGPGENMCADSKVFYSNEFEVVGGKNDLCEDKVLENCDGKRVSIIGTFIISKAHFLSDIENREVKYQWAGEIMIDDSRGMKEGKRYKVIGIVRKGGQPCGMNNEQCMLDEKGVILPYPTRIEVEKIYSIK